MKPIDASESLTIKLGYSSSERKKYKQPYTFLGKAGRPYTPTPQKTEDRGAGKLGETVKPTTTAYARPHFPQILPLWN